MHRIEPVAAEIGNVTPGIVEEPPVRSLEPLPVEGHHRRRSEVHVPVHPLGNFGIGDLLARHVAAVVPDAHEVHVTDLAALDDLLDLLVMRRRSMLRAVLDDAVVLPGCLDHLPPLDDVVAERLFDVDILARLAGEHGGNGVPVIRRGDQHGMDVLPIQRPAEILVALRLRGGKRARARLGDRGVRDIADGHEGNVRHFGHVPRDQASTASTADERDVHSIVRAENVL